MDQEYGDRPSAKEAQETTSTKGYEAALARYHERCASEGREPLPERYGIDEIPALIERIRREVNHV